MNTKTLSLGLGMATAAALTLAPEPAHAAEKIGGGGGTQYSLMCGNGGVATGVAVARSRNRRFVGHFGVICSARRDVQNDRNTPIANQRIHWSSFAPADTPLGNDARRNGASTVRSSASPNLWIFNILRGLLSGVPLLNVLPDVTSIAFWDSTIRPFADTMTTVRCPTGYAMQGITGRAGSYVDRIGSITCAHLPTLEDPTTKHFVNGNVAQPVLSRTVGVGRYGGTHATSFCDQGNEFVSGTVVRSGHHLDSLQATCTSIPRPQSPPRAKITLRNESGVNATCWMTRAAGGAPLATVFAPAGQSNFRRYQAPANSQAVVVRCRNGGTLREAGRFTMDRTDWNRATVVVQCGTDRQCQARPRTLPRG